MSLLSERQKEELYVYYLLSSFHRAIRRGVDAFRIGYLCTHHHVITRRHKSILDYLHSQNLSEAYNALKAEVKIDYTPDPKSKYAGLLEKKWTSVIRLQKKVRIVGSKIIQ